MGFLAELLDELYDVWLMFCEDCQKKYKTKKSGEPLVQDRRCIRCRGSNTRIIQKSHPLPDVGKEQNE